MRKPYYMSLKDHVHSWAMVAHGPWSLMSWAMVAHGPCSLIGHVRSWAMFAHGPWSLMGHGHSWAMVAYRPCWLIGHVRSWAMVSYGPWLLMGHVHSWAIVGNFSFVGPILSNSALIEVAKICYEGQQVMNWNLWVTNWQTGSKSW